MPDYNQHVRLLSPEPWLVGTTKVYSGTGADIVMESLHSSSLFIKKENPTLSGRALPFYRVSERGSVDGRVNGARTLSRNLYRH
jgi:hypothetical protein